MPTFQYRALTQVGEIVTGSLDASSVAEVNRRVEYLGLIPVEASAARGARPFGKSGLSLTWLSRPRAEEVTIFTADLALLLRTGARINDALELLAADADIGRMRATIAALATSVLSGESFGEAISRHPSGFPADLCRTGSRRRDFGRAGDDPGSAGDRASAGRGVVAAADRHAALSRVPAARRGRRAAVLPSRSCCRNSPSVFRDFNAKLDPVLVAFLGLSDLLRSNGQAIAAALLARHPRGLACYATARDARVGSSARSCASRSCVRSWTIVARASSVATWACCCRTASRCRRLLRILADTMEASGSVIRWSNIVDKVRHGGKLSDALTATEALPLMAIRTMRLGEDSGQLPMLAGRIADFYEAKLQRSLDRAIGVVGPLAIIVISVIVGGLIVSVMTALLSVNQVVG